MENRKKAVFSTCCGDETPHEWQSPQIPPFPSIALHSKSSFPFFKKYSISPHYTDEGNTFQVSIQRRNGGGFALREGRSTRSKTGLAPGASAAHRRWIADKERPERKGAVARQASNPLEAAEKRGVPGGLQRGPRRGGAPNRPPLPPREAATLRGRESARQRSREPSPTHYIIILNH